MLSRIIALSLLFAAIVWSQPTINTARPRIWLDAAKLAEIQAKPTGTAAEQAQWTAMKDWVDTWCTDSNPETSFDCLRNSLTVHITDSTLDPPGSNYSTYAEIACASADYHVTSGQVNEDWELKNGNQNRWYTTWIILVYDWLHDDCTSTQMDNMYDQLIKVPDFVQSVWGLPNRTVNNLGIGFVMNGILAPIALHGDWAPAQSELDETWANAIVQYMFPCQDDDTASAMQFACYGGSWPEGIEYAPESKFLVWRTFEGIRTGTDTDPFTRADVQQFLSDSWEFLKHNTLPALHNGEFEPMMYRDTQHFRSGTDSDQEWVENMFEYFARTGQTTKAEGVKYWLDNYAGGYSNSGSKWQQFLWVDPDYTATDYRIGNTNFESPFMVMSRSDWTADATHFAAFEMPSNFDHFHDDGGSWALYRGGELLSSEIQGYFQKVVLSPYSHNSLMANTGGPGCYNNSGPIMGAFTREGSGWKTACAPGDNYCYAQHDLSPQFACSSYQVTKDVDWAFRDVLYVKPDLVIYSDRLQFITGLDAPYASMVQFVGQPSVTDQRITHTVGTQKIVVDSVLPAGANIGIRNRDSATGTEYITWAKKIDDDNCIVCVDLSHGLSSGANYTISGITGDWSDLNGTWSITVPTKETFGPQNGTGHLPYRDGAEYYKECFVITSTGAFSGITTNWDFANNIPGRSSVGTGDLQFNDNTYYALIAGNAQTNTQSGLVVAQAMDSGGSPVATSAISTIDSSHHGVEVSLATPVAAVFNTTSAPVTSATFTSTYSGTGDVYVSGLQPGTYDVTLDGGQIVNDQSVDNDGMLAFSSSAGAFVVTQDGAGAPLEITTTSLPAGTTGQAYSQDLAATGGTSPYSWALDSGSLCSGLTLSTSGTISGTPDTAETCNFTARVTDDVAATDTQALAITIDAAGAPLEITTTSLPAGTTGQAYSQDLAATGGTSPYSWALDSGSLCSGLTLSTSGTISGTPDTAETCSFTVIVTDDSSSTDTQGLSLTVSASGGLVITTTTLPAGLVDQSYSETLAATGGTPPYSWSVLGGETCGFQLSETGVVSGTPTHQRTCALDVKAVDAAAAETTATIDLTVASPEPLLLLAVERSSQAAIVLYGDSRLDANQTCRLILSDDSGFSSILESVTDSGGSPWRRHVLGLSSTLSANTTYYARAVCGPEEQQLSVTTETDPPAETRTLSFEMAAGTLPSLDHVLIEYGIGGSLNQAVIAPCVSSCQTSVDLPAGSLVRFRRIYRDASNTVLATSAETSLVVQ